MPGVVQHTRETLKKAVSEACAAGLGGVMLFGIPAEKDATGSGALDPRGILNVAITDVVGEAGDQLSVMSDLCLDEFTDHGHCGVLDPDGSWTTTAPWRSTTRWRSPTPGRASTSSDPAG